MRNTNILIIILLLLIVVFAIWFSYKPVKRNMPINTPNYQTSSQINTPSTNYPNPSNTSNNNTTVKPTTNKITVSGKYICLPHRNTSGPQTLECAFGIQTDNNLYYALDFNLMSQQFPNISTNQRITVSGVYTPVEALSSNIGKIYPITGIISVTDFSSK